MYQYQNLLHKLLEVGNQKGDRTGTGTRSLFGEQLRFNLQEGFPLVTTKKMFTKGIIHELLWMLSGDTNIKYLVDNGVNIWNEWAWRLYNQSNPEHQMKLSDFAQAIKDNMEFALQWGDLGPVYGKQWRRWEGDIASVDIEADVLSGRTNLAVGRLVIDQIDEVISILRTDPNSRRMVVSAWNPADLRKVALHWCHCLFQFYVADGKLSCQLYQRSADTFLGLPFNIASYALLTHMIAQQCDLDVGEFIWTGGDVHLYNNHVDQAQEQLRRVAHPLPTLNLRRADSISDYKFEDFEIVGYESHPAIGAEVSI